MVPGVLSYSYREATDSQQDEEEIQPIGADPDLSQVSHAKTLRYATWVLRGCAYEIFLALFGVSVDFTEVI